MDTAEPFFHSQGQCRACLHKWGLAASDLCDCDIVDTCLQSKFDGGSWCSTRWTIMKPTG